MDRYWYEPAVVIILDGEEEDSMDGFYLYDSKHGNTEGRHIAFCVDRDRAEQIIQVLNEEDACRSSTTQDR